MFDIGFSELLLIAVVALLVLGPERLPKAARLAGLWARKARAQWNAVKAELENEIADEELRRNLREASDAMREGAAQVRALPDVLRNDPLPGDATPAMTAIDPAPMDAAPTTSPDGSASMDTTPLTPGLSAERSSVLGRTDPWSEDAPDHPAQLSLLDPDPALTQMTASPSSSRPRSDG
jgi:sec-independent protein translocase protein TatB